jgi:lipid-A-disaccharide synthase
MASSGTHVFVVAGEESGDRLGFALIEALRRASQGRARVTAVGGEHLAAAGAEWPLPTADMAAMGLAALPSMIGRTLRRIREVADAVVAAKPDVLVIIDSPEFTHRVARRVRRLMPSLPIVDYVSPSVWAWRPGRARAMRAYVDRILALLPFEPAVHARLGGPPCTFVGHPMTERVKDLRPNAEEAARRKASPPILLVMPGSRRGEIARMLDVFAATVERVASRTDALEVIVPTLPRLAGDVRTAVQRWRVPARVVDDAAGKDAAFRIARAALVKSGTGTLELALAGIPMVAGYRVSWIEYQIFSRLIETPSIILANLVLGENVVPELIQHDLTPERLTDEIVPLLRDGPQRAAQVDAFARLDTIMEIGAAVPSDRAAAVVLDVARAGRNA